MINSHLLYRLSYHGIIQFQMQRLTHFNTTNSVHLCETNLALTTLNLLHFQSL
jgi:hypothetical protein